MALLSMGDFAVPLPSDWSIIQTVATKSGPERRFRPNIVTSREPLGNGETLEGFAKRTWTSLREAFRNLSLVDEQAVKRGRCQAYRREYIIRPDDDRESQQPSLPQTLMQLQYYFLGDSEVIALTASDLPDHFAETKRVVEEMVARLRFEGGDRLAEAAASRWE